MKKSLLPLCAIGILLFTNCTQKKDPWKDLDYLEICEEYDKYAFEQKDLLKLIRNKFYNDKAFIIRFNEEQSSWLQFQNKRLRSLYPKDWDRYYRKEFGKELFNGCKCKELARLSKIRNDDLKVYLNGPSQSQLNCPIQGNEQKEGI